MSFIRSSLIASLLATCILFGGCAHKKAPTAAPATQPALGTSEDAMAAFKDRLGDMIEISDNLEVRAGKLPGKTEAAHNQIMAGVLTDLSQFLSMIGGPENSNELNGELGIMHDCVERLLTGSGEPPSDAIVDTALQAAYHGLIKVSKPGFAGQQDIEGALAQTAAQLDELYSVHGPEHRLVASQVVQTMSSITGKMSQFLMDRIGWKDEPTTQPATNPTPAPATDAGMKSSGE